MKALPIEMKQRIVELREEHGLKYEEIAHWLGTSLSLVKKVMVLHKEGKSLVPQKPGPRGQRTFSSDLVERIRDFVFKNKDATLAQIQDHYSSEVSCSIPTFHRLLVAQGFRYKKNSSGRRAG
jgi:transposase